MTEKQFVALLGKNADINFCKIGLLTANYHSLLLKCPNKEVYKYYCRTLEMQKKIQRVAEVQNGKDVIYFFFNFLRKVILTIAQ